MRIYLLVYSSVIGDNISVSKKIREVPEVQAWRYDISNCFYIKSECTANQLYKALRKKMPNGRIFVTEISSNRQGFITTKSWDFIKSV